MVNLLLAGLAIQHLRGDWPVDGFNDIRHGAWFALLAINAIMLVTNLVPRKTFFQDQQVSTDGARLLAFLGAPATPVPGAREAMELRTCLRQGNRAEAEKWLTRLSAFPQHAATVAVGKAQLLGEAGDWAAAGRLLREALSTIPPQTLPLFYAWIAVADVYAGLDLADARILSQRCMEFTPWDPAMQAVRATVLLADGETAAAGEVLRAMPPTDPGTPAHKATCWVFAEHRRRLGDTRGQARWERRARRHDPHARYRLPPPAPRMAPHAPSTLNAQPPQPLPTQAAIPS
jgi:hypothetical protein